MLSLRHIRRRIATVRNTAQVTRAMKMISAIKLRRAQQALFAIRPYAREIHATLKRIALHKDISDHPLLAQRKPYNKEDLFVLTSDRGLAGAFNSNVLRTVEHYLRANHERINTIFIHTIGRKGYMGLIKRKFKVQENIEDLISQPNYPRVVDLAQDASARFISKQVDRVTLVYNEFYSPTQQRVVFRVLLPLDSLEETGEKQSFVDYLYEPDKETLLDQLIHCYLTNQMFTLICESVASEHGARMTAMDSATNNARDMIQNLTLAYNKARQGVITSELMEIMGGAEALR